MMDDGVFGEPKPASSWPSVQAAEARNLAQRLAKRLLRIEGRMDRLRDKLKVLQGDRTLTKAHAADELKALRKGLAQVMRRLEALEARLAALEGRPQVAKAAAPGARGGDALVAKAGALGAGELMGLLSRVIRDPGRVAVAEHFCNRGDVAAALSTLTLEERGEVARLLQGL